MIREQISENYFVLIKGIFTEKEINSILQVIDNQKEGNSNFKFNKDLFAICCFLKEIPQLTALIINDKLKELIGLFD